MQARISELPICDPCPDLILNTLAAGGTELAFQPILRSEPNAAVGFFEALARLRLPNGEVLLPGAFLPVVERAGRIPQLDRYVLRHALSTLEKTPKLRLSVNVGLQTLADRGWLNLLKREAADRPGITDRMIVEMTELAVADPAVTGPFARQLRILGVTVLLDDFGAGHTAFRQFRDLALDGVKIDGFFSRGIERDADSQCLVRALVDIARHFEMFTVAEYVQTLEQAQCLTDLGVDFLQGDLFAPAMREPTWITAPHGTGRCIA